MFLGTLGSKRVAMSYSLIKYLGYNAEEMAIDAIKFRTICLEYNMILWRIFSAQTYPVGIKYNLNCIKYMAELALGKITFQQFSELTTFSFQDFIISKDNVVFHIFRLSPLLIPLFLLSPPSAMFIKSIKCITKLMRPAVSFYSVRSTNLQYKVRRNSSGRRSIKFCWNWRKPSLATTSKKTTKKQLVLWK